MNNDIIGLYAINGIEKTNKIRINHISNIELKKDMVIKDQEVKKYVIEKLDAGVVYGYIYKSIITHHYINSSKRLPLFYINVIWVMPIQIILLYRIIVYFDITSEINSVADLFDKEIEGVFSTHTIVNNKNIPLEENIIKYSGDTKVIAKLEKLTMMGEMIDYLHDLIALKKNEIAKKYGSRNYKIPENIISLKDIDIE